MANRRIEAAKILQTVLEEKVFFTELKKKVSKDDLPFINMLILTALRRLVAVEKLLAGFLKKKIPHKKRMAQYLLILAVTEIFYLDTPVYAVVDETVDCIKKTTDRFLSGLANAVLRRIIEQKSILKTRADNISALPETFLPLLADYGKDEIAKTAESIYMQPALDLSVKKNPENYAQDLSATLLPNGSLRIFEKTFPNFSGSDYWAQDVAASLPVLAMGNVKNLKVVDLCAAPGGKTAQLAAAGANVTAVDISQTRLEILKQNMQRLSFPDIRVVCADAANFLHSEKEKYDMILLDAPCSATGTFRRHPEILHTKTLQDVEEQTKIQYQLLQSCSLILKVGGFLVYSVCSICRQEGEKMIENFLQNNNTFKLVPIERSLIEKYGQWSQNFISENGTIRTLPFYEKELGGMDSFYICKMQRII